MAAARRHQTGELLADWLADRITEVERAVRKLPSIAVFVDGDEQIDPLVNLLRPRLEERNIRIVGCKDGRVVGDRQEVRVFDVQHIKGLEFEGIFFVGIDHLAARLPEIFDRYFYVGVSRAATYLGVTCEAELPARAGAGAFRTRALVIVADQFIFHYPTYPVSRRHFIKKTQGAP